MLYEKKMLKEESVMKKISLDITSLNRGVYSLQVKVWGISINGRKLAISTPFYPLKINDRDQNHKRIFCGKIIEVN